MNKKRTIERIGLYVHKIVYLLDKLEIPYTITGKGISKYIRTKHYTIRVSNHINDNLCGYNIVPQKEFNNKELKKVVGNKRLYSFSRKGLAALKEDLSKGKNKTI